MSVGWAWSTRWRLPVCACRPCRPCGAWTTSCGTRRGAHTACSRVPFTCVLARSVVPARNTRMSSSTLPGPAAAGDGVWGPNRHIDDVACSRRLHVASPAAEETARRFAPGCCCSTNVNSSAHSAPQGANAAALQHTRRRRRVNVETFASGGAHAKRREGSPQIVVFSLGYRRIRMGLCP